MRTQYQVQNETKIRRNQKVIKKESDELIVKIYPKNRESNIQQQKIKPPNCPSCKRNNWSEFDKGYYCKNCENFINKQKHQIDKKNRGQDHNFSNTLPYAIRKIREIWINMVNTTNSSSEDMIDKLQSLKSKTQLQFYKNISNYFDDMKHKIFRTQEDLSATNAQGISKPYQEVLLIMKFLQIKPQVKNMNFNYHDLYYSVNKNIDEN